MDRSPCLQKELRDGGLRQIIATVVTQHYHRQQQQEDPIDYKSRNRNGRYHLGQQHPNDTSILLDQTMTDYPESRIFLDKLLVLAGVLERREVSEPSTTEIDPCSKTAFAAASTATSSTGTSLTNQTISTSLEEWLEEL